MVPYALADYTAGRGNVLKWNLEGGDQQLVFIEQIVFRDESLT